MKCHGDRDSYFIVGEEAVEISSYEEIFKRLSNGSGSVAVHVASATSGTPTLGAATASAAAVAQPGVNEDPEPKYKFGWISGRTKKHYPPSDALLEKVAQLGRCMNDPSKCPNQPPAPGTSNGSPQSSDESTITSGYTYLGQLLAHEITFDKEQLPNPESFRSPQIDLDSLYGRGPQHDAVLFQNDGMRLKIGTTNMTDNLHVSFENDLPRMTSAEPKENGKAIIADPRNDENLAIAQMHVAFSKFHNKVVDDLVSRFPGTSAAELFARAREEVIKYFQWIIVHDYLPMIVGQAVVDQVRDEGVKGFRFAPEDSDKLFIPLEFSVAAFRIGHSMVRNNYIWNGDLPSVNLIELFSHTRHSGTMTKLPSNWIIDWRGFFDFEGLPYPAIAKRNMAMAIDTSFELHIEQIPNYPHKVPDPDLQAITIRNLIRSYQLGVPYGEEMAVHFDVEPLPAAKLRATKQKLLLEDQLFEDATPLWYYILREAEIVRQEEGVNRLGEVGGLVVAGTLMEIIRHSPFSILRQNWEPRFGRPPIGSGPPRFHMADLLHEAGVVAPIASYQGE